jgi:hypothetical protein
VSPPRGKLNGKLNRKLKLMAGEALSNAPSTVPLMPTKLNGDEAVLGAESQNKHRSLVQIQPLHPNDRYILERSSVAEHV